MDPYEERKVWRKEIESILHPVEIKVGLVWQLQAGVCLIWNWGKVETGFAFGPTPEAAAHRAMAIVFGGL